MNTFYLPRPQQNRKTTKKRYKETHLETKYDRRYNIYIYIYIYVYVYNRYEVKLLSSFRLFQYFKKIIEIYSK